MLRGLLAALLVLVGDQISKALVYGYVEQFGHAVTINSFFNLVMAWNKGVSFSMFDNLGGYGVYILSGFSLLVVSVLFYWLCKEDNKLIQWALGFVIGGALGNVVDRVRLGAVYDFLDVHVNEHHWPAFNVADSFICIGATIILVTGLFFDKKDKTEM